MAKLLVLFESADFIAIEKPAGLATIPGRGETDSALEQLARQIGLPASGNDDPRLRVVHRLDKDTSGVLLFAKNVVAQRHVSHQFQNNQVEKEYLAIVGGTPAEREGIIDAPIGVHPTDKKRMHVTKHGRPAVTAWRIEQAYRRYALVRCFPKTGKTHQIRVHLTYIGHALAVDPIYGSSAGLLLSQFKRDYRPKLGEDERALINRLTLHAEKLRFVALDGSRVEITSPPPKDFRVAVAQLAKHAR